MSEEKWAIITGADGGMGTEITRAVAEAGYHIIMACYRPSNAIFSLFLCIIPNNSLMEQSFSDISLYHEYRSARELSIIHILSNITGMWDHCMFVLICRHSSVPFITGIMMSLITILTPVSYTHLSNE